MKKYTVNNYEYTVSLEDNVIEIKAINWETMVEYIHEIREDYIKDYSIIDTIEVLYEFITDCFEMNDNKFTFKEVGNKLVLNALISTKYKNESHTFTLSPIKEVDNLRELNNRMKFFAKELEKTKEELNETKLELAKVKSEHESTINKIVNRSYLIQPDGILLDNKASIRCIIIDFNKDTNIYRIVFSHNQGTYMHSTKEVNDMGYFIQQFEKIDEITLMCLPISNLDTIFTKPIHVRYLRVIKLSELVDYTFLNKVKCNLEITAPFSIRVDWQFVISYNNVESFEIEANLSGMVVKGSKPASTTIDGKNVNYTLNKYK